MSNVPKAKNKPGPKIPGTDDYKQHKLRKAVAYGALAKEARHMAKQANLLDSYFKVPDSKSKSITNLSNPLKPSNKRPISPDDLTSLASSKLPKPKRLNITRYELC